MRATFRSLRGRLALLVLATSAPAIAILVYIGIDANRQAYEDSRRQTLEAAKIAGSEIEDLGYEVRTAADGPSALASLDRDSNIHLMLTDFVMAGGMNGAELGKRVRRLYPLIKIVYTSGYAEGAVRKQPGDDGSDQEWIAKPYEKHRLAQKIRAVLDGNLGSQS